MFFNKESSPESRAAEQDSGDRLIRTTQDHNARMEKILRAATLPGTLLGAAAGVALVVFGLAPLLALTTYGTVMCSVIPAVLGAGASFGTLNNAADKYGLRNLFVGHMQAERMVKKFQAEAEYHMPLNGSATKAFIKAISDGIREKLHIGKPLTYRKPDPEKLEKLGRGICLIPRPRI